MRRGALPWALVTGLLLCGAVSTRAAAADERPSLVVLGLKALGIDKSTQSILVRQLSAEIEKLGTFRVLPYQEYHAKLEMTSERVLAVCGVKVDCYVEAGRQLGAHKVVIGVISGLGKSRTINLKLIDVADGVLENDVSRAVIGKSESLIPALGELAQTLIEFVNELKVIVENVADASVAIDGREVGKGREVLVANTRVGKHSLQVTRDGYAAHTQFFSITYGDRKTLTVALRPTRGFLQIEASEAGAQVLLDGKEIGSAPLNEVLVKPGRHKLGARSRYHGPAEQVVSVRAGERKIVTLTLRQLEGSLQVTSVPEGATVSVAGSPALGTTPVSAELTAGKYTIGLARDGFAPQEQEIEVLPEGVNRYEFKLTAQVPDDEDEDDEDDGRAALPPQARPDPAPAPGTGPGAGDDAWYETWWIWVIAGVGLAAVATAIAVPLSLDQDGGSNLPGHDDRVNLP